MPRLCGSGMGLPEDYTYQRLLNIIRIRPHEIRSRIGYQEYPDRTDDRSLGFSGKDEVSIAKISMPPRMSMLGN